MMAKIAYGKREDIQQAIDNGVIPENTTIITNETEPELLFYDKNKKLKTIDEKSRFYSLIEVSQWLEKYDCGGLFFSVYDKGKWTPYVINHENEMIPFAELYDDTPLKEQIELLIGDVSILETTDKSSVVGAINETVRKQERLQYYGDANIVPTDMTKFKFTISDGTASIDGFADGVTLTDIVIPYKYVDDNGNEYRVTTISDSAFFHIPSLTSVIIPSAITEIRQQAFESCGVTSVYIPDRVITIGKYAFQSSTIKKVRLSNSLAEISEGVFATCPIEEIVIPDSVTSIGGAAFVFAKDTHITIPHNVTSLGDYVFEGCTSLLEVEILNDNITISNDAFVDCTNVTIICGEGSTAEAFCKAHSIPYRYNTVTDDFIITGSSHIFDDVIALYGIEVPYIEIKKAFDEGKNVWLCLTELSMRDTNTRIKLPLVAVSDEMALFSIVDHEGAPITFFCRASDNYWIGYRTPHLPQKNFDEYLESMWDFGTRIRAIEEKIPALENKTDKVTITTLSDTVLAVDFAEMYNSEIRTGELTSISFTFGNDAYEEDYTSGISFDSGETPTAIDYTDSGILNWVGTDCATSDGLSIFQPSANTHYDIVFYFNGNQFIGLVNGFVPSTGNEAV